MSDEQPINDPAQPAWGMLRRDSLADGIMLLLLLTIIQRGVGLARGVLFCRWLATPEEVGRWDAAFGFFMIAAPMAVLGLPGSFGRYLEYYQRRGQLRSYLKRTLYVCAGTVTAVVSLLLAFQKQAAQWIFGSAEDAPLVRWIALGLAAVVCFNALVSLVTAWRLVRLATLLQLAHTIAFAVVGAGLIWWVSPTGLSASWAYALACVISSGLVLGFLIVAWRQLPAEHSSPPQSSFWIKLLPFAAWLWVTNVLFNCFEQADRYLILHGAGFSQQYGLALLGQYHSARIVPNLFLSLAELITGLLTPYLAHDWEKGNRQAVVERLNFILKITSLGMTAGGAIFLAASPLLYRVVFVGKFAGVDAILPTVTAAYVWFSLVAISQNYLLCAEKARFNTLAMAIGLPVVVVLNLALVPSLHLQGAAFASAAARLTTLIGILIFAGRFGFKLDWGTRLLVLLPGCLMLGVPWCLPVLALFAIWSGVSGSVFTQNDRSRMHDIWRQYAGRLGMASQA